ncbi:hypothetical protein SDC9_138452 [bioreactor metagenome]|uniref:Uncharacterized protein n=1 Tax=bioreactor metagenome TaxID=1076179 RepID=A0A645DPC1_9ZZZZ
MKLFWKIIKISFIVSAVFGVWQGIEHGNPERVLLNSLLGCYWLAQL